MPKIATADEERLLSGELTLTLEESGVAFPIPKDVKIVYLGGHPHKTMRMFGTIKTETETDPETQKVLAVMKSIQDGGYTVYDFSTVDSRGRKLRNQGPWAQITTPAKSADDPPEGKRWQPCEHLHHIWQFFNSKDAEGQRQFSIRAPAESMQVIKRYIEQMRQRKPGNPDRGLPVLNDMADVLAAS